MSDAVLIVLTTSIASIISIVISQVIAGWISKRKTNAETGKIYSDTNLSQGDLILKYQKIAGDQADENIGLFGKIKQQEEENKELLSSIQQLRNDMIKMDESYKQEIAQLKESFEIERKEDEAWKKWAKRLVSQLESLGFVSVPFDVEEAKIKGYSMGDMGKYQTKEGDN